MHAGFPAGEGVAGEAGSSQGNPGWAGPRLSSKVMCVFITDFLTHFIWIHDGR
ncbi:hypothetical protein LEMLEM_LOCUS18838 [Lemmus lemmus]